MIIFPPCFISDRFGLLRTPLQKIITGGVLVAISFVVSALVELKLEDTYPTPPEDEEARLNFHNGLADCTLDIQLIDFSRPLPDISLPRKF